MGGNNDLDIERLKQEYESLKDENNKLKMQVEDLRQ
jgi:cell division protein FtsB